MYHQFSFGLSLAVVAAFYSLKINAKHKPATIIISTTAYTHKKKLLMCDMGRNLLLEHSKSSQALRVSEC